MPQKNNDDQFYAELDKARHKPSVSCGSLAFLLIFMLIALGYIVYWGISQVKQQVTTKDTPISAQALEMAETKLQAFLFGNELKNQSVTLTLTDEELTSLLVKNEVLAQNDTFALKDPSAVISPQQLELSGVLTKPIDSKLVIYAKPVIVNGRLELKVNEVKAGKLTVPSFIRQGIDELLNRLVTGRLNSNNIAYDSAVLGDHVLTLTGRIK